MISASVLEDAFPKVSPGVTPLGTRVMVQLRCVRTKTASGLLLVSDTKEFNKSSTQLAKVVSMGQIAYCNRNSGERWPEGTWVDVGDLVRVPKHGGDRFSRDIEDTEDSVIFAIFQDHEIIAKVDADSFESIDDLK